VAVHRNNFLFTNQPDEQFSKFICQKTVHISGIFFAHNQEFSTVLSALESFMQVLMTISKQGHQNLHEIYQCRMYGRTLLMMGRENVRNM
jgi:hypothetical protein